jgi:hypothetical protein
LPAAKVSETFRTQAKSRRCKHAILRGGYGSGSTGLFQNTSNDPFLPFAEAAHFVFDGRGNLSGSTTLNSAGTVFAVKFAGTYTVNANCTRSYAIDAGEFGILHRDLLIVDDGKEVEFVETDAAVVLGGYMKKQFTDGE